jgi:hypothetical protein
MSSSVARRLEGQREMRLLQRLHHALLAARESRGLQPGAGRGQIAEQRLGQAHDLVVIDRARGRQDHLPGP